MDIYIICHRAVVTADLEAEWQQHQSRFFVMWLSWMRKKRKLALLPNCRRQDLREAIEALECAAIAKTAMIEDMHLVEAALVTDLRIASRDRNARDLFQRHADEIGELGVIRWLDPTDGDRPPGRR